MFGFAVIKMAGFIVRDHATAFALKLFNIYNPYNLYTLINLYF